LVKEAQAGQPTIFITLTSRRVAGRSPHAAARALVVAWRKVRQEYVKDHGKGSLPFLAVFEATKKGWPHLHIVARAKWVDQRWLSRRMASLIGAPVVDVRAITGLAMIAHYVAKYVGKNPHRFNGVKRYWRSLDYLTPCKDPPVMVIPWWAEWYIVKEKLEYFCFSAKQRGHRVEYVRGGAQIHVRGPP
jgi:hypothetical protein